MQLHWNKFQFGLVMAMALFVLQGIFLCQESQAGWYNGNWLYRVKVTVDDAQVPGDLTDFPIYVDLDDMPDAFFDNVDSAGADIRVTKTDGTTEVAREVVFINTTSNDGELHFKAAGTLSSSSNSDWYLYYGNTSASEPSASSTYGSQMVWNGNNFVGVWHLQEDPGGSAPQMQDSHKNDNDGTAYGSMNSSDQVAVQLAGYGTHFDGSNDYFGVGTASALAPSNISVSAWARTDVGPANYDMIAIKATSDAWGDGWGIYFGGSTSVKFYIEDYTDAASKTSVTCTNWNHYFGTWDGTTIRMYVNSSEGTSYAYGGSISTGGTTEIGRGRNNSFNMDGKIDEFRIADTARSSNWITTEYNNQNTPESFYTVGSQESRINHTAFIPPDNGSGMDVSDNLVITFTVAADIQTGNITIKKLSDNSTVQTIDVTDAAVTGNGTTTITINPSDLAYSTDYYVNIDSGAFEGLYGDDYPGITGNGTWNFTTAGWYNGDWNYRVQLKVDDDKVSGDQTDFPIYVDLDDMPDEFFDNVKAAGADIRVTLANGTGLVPREVVFVNTTANDGELYFKATGTLSGSADTYYYIYYGNASASEPTANGEFAKENVWNGNDYVAVYHMQEDPSGSAPQVIDSTRYDNDCTSYGSMASGDLVAGKLAGNGMDLDGSNDYFKCGSDSALDNMDDYTASAWSYTHTMPSGGGWDSILSKVTSGNDGNYLLYHNVGANEINNYVGGSNPKYVSGNASSVDLNTWIYFHSLMDFSTGGAGTAQIYKNGAEVTYNQQDTTGSGRVSDAAQELFIGSEVNPPSGHGYFDGLLDEIRIADVKKAEGWLVTEYNNMNSPSTFYTASAQLTEVVADTTNPTVSTYSPADGATEVSETANLVLTFDEAVDAETGNITIKKSSDDSTVETIAVGSANVTGSGSTTITINPTNDLALNTGYYVNIDATGFDDAAGNSYAGISNSTTWNFTTRAWYNGDWGYRLKITVEDEKVNGDLTDFPVYIDMDDLPGDFFDNVKSDGSDIRMTKSDGTTEIAREVVFINTTSNDGEMYFKAAGTLSGSSNSDYYMYYGNASATEPTANGEFAKENVWNGNNFAAVYHFQEDPSGSGPQILDSSKNDNDGTSGGSMVGSDSVDGKLAGKALDFDGSDDNINVPDSSSLDITQGTTSMWVKFGSDDNVTYPAPYCKQAVNAAYMMIVYSDETMIWRNHISGTYRDAKQASTGVTVGTYENWVGTYDGSTMRLYRDSSEVATKSQAGSISTTANDLRIGDCTNTYSYQGEIDEFRIASVARTEEWVNTAHNNQNSPGTFYSVGSQETGILAVTNLSPNDDATAAAVDSNLTITFNKNIDIQTGNLTILKFSDNSTIETIDITGATGNGTTAITVNPSADLDYGTQYYVNIDATALDDENGTSYAGISDNGTWNFTTETWYNGDWAYRIKLTVENSKVDASLEDYPIFVDLDDMPDAFFDNVKAAGADIRVTKSDGSTEVAREVVAIDTTANDGELHFKAAGTLSSTSNSDFYLYYGNSGASEPTANGQYAKENVWNGNDYIAVFHLEEDPSGSAPQNLDSTLNDYDTTSAGSMTGGDSVAGKLGGGKCLDFDGTDDYLEKTGISYTNTMSWTLQAWVNNDDTTDNMYVGMGTVSSDYDYIGIWDTVGSANKISAGRWATTWTYSEWSTSPTTSTWYSIVATYNHADTLKLYVNGSEMDSDAETSNNVTIDRFRIGRAIYSDEAPHNGKIDEVRISNGARAATWISTEFNNHNSPSTFYSVGSQEGSDATAPTVSTYSPADGATGVAVDANLVLTFSEAVDAETGNITVKRSSDDSTFETIAVGSVTGSGTTTITINPTSNLEYNTGYYVNIDATAFDDSNDNSYAGISDTTTWNFTTDAAGWHASDWGKRIQLTIDNTKVNGDLTDFPVYVDLSDLSSKDFFNNVNSDGGDIRVTKSDGQTPLAFEIVAIDTTNNAGEMHFKADSLSNSVDTVFYIYYDNSNARLINPAHALGAQNVWSNGYAAVYHLEEDGNTGAKGYKDSTSARNHANGVSLTSSSDVTGKLGKAQDLDGSADYLTVANDSNSLDIGTGDFSITSWVQLDTTSNDYYIIYDAEETSSSRYSLMVYNTDKPTLQMGGTAVQSTSTITDTNWHHVAVTADRDGNASFYLDTTLDTSSISAHSSMDTQPDAIVIGARHNTTDHYFNGKIDELRVSNGLRSTAYIITEYNNHNSPSTFYTVGNETLKTADSEPKVQTYDPRNRATEVPLKANLVLTFDENVDVTSGNVYIKKISDDSTVQTIDITSGSVTGTGTTVITINPSDLTADTEYYVIIENTCLEDSSDNKYSGISSSGTWRFKTVAGTSSKTMFLLGF